MVLYIKIISLGDLKALLRIASFNNFKL